MKIITLNTWGGRAGKEDLLSFFKKYKDVDIICLQEIYHEASHVVIEDRGDVLELFSEIQKILNSHIGYFKAAIPNYGIAMFIKKDYEVFEEGSQIMYEPTDYQGGGNHSRNFQYVTSVHQGKKITVINLHGLWNGKGKTDTEERLMQSKKVLEFTKTLTHDFIICGDFNLLPDTESLKMFEQSGLKNLIKEFDIKDTRTSHYKKPERFADYMFTTKNIEVIDFKVLPEEVSDHAALYLEIA